MRIRGFRRSLYLLTSSRPEIDRMALRLCRSLEEVRELIKKNEKFVKKK